MKDAKLLEQAQRIVQRLTRKQLRDFVLVYGAIRQKTLDDPEAQERHDVLEADLILRRLTDQGLWEFVKVCRELKLAT